MESPSGQRHHLSARFHQILRGLGDLHDLKQLDYGAADDPFANIRSSADFGIRPWVGALVRGNDKMKRLQKLSREGNLANEPAVDSFRDLAVYAIIALVLFEEEEVGAVVMQNETEMVEEDTRA